MKNKFLISLIIIGLILQCFSFISHASFIESFGNFNSQSGYLDNRNTISWSNLRNSSGIYLADLGHGDYETTNLYTSGTYDYLISRGYFFFDTSAIPDNAIITNISFAFNVFGILHTPFYEYGMKANTGISLDKWDFNLVNFSYNVFNYTMTSTGDKNISFTENISSFINKTGISCLVMMKYWDYFNICPLLYYNLQWYGTDFNSLKLWVSYYILPEKPYNIVTDISYNNINLSWDNGNYSDRTVIFSKIGSYPVFGEGLIYNDTGNFFNHTGLNNNNAWYYTFYGYNSTDNKFSLDYTYIRDTTLFLITYTDISINNLQFFIIILIIFWLYFVNKYLIKRTNVALALTQFLIMIPLDIIFVSISFTYTFGFTLVFILPVISIYLVADAIFYHKNKE